MPTKKFEIVSVGTALRDVMYYTDQLSVLKNPVNDPTRARLLCVEFGAKIRSEHVYFAFGGGGANTAINFARLGLQTGILSTTGFDLDGRGIRDNLQHEGVDLSLLQVTQDHRTGFSFLVVDEKSGEHTAYVYYGAAGDLSLKQSSLDRHPSDWYYVSSLTTPNWKKVIGLLVNQKDSKVAWNPGGKQLKAGYNGLKPLIAKTTLLILNKDEASELVLSHPKMKKAGSIPQMLRVISQWGPKVVVITNSRKGAFTYNSATGEQFFLKPPIDKPKDTTGAGDAYGSALVAGYIRYKGDLKKAMKLAQVSATAQVREIGAQQGLLAWKDLPKDLQKIG